MGSLEISCSLKDSNLIFFIGGSGTASSAVSLLQRGNTRREWIWIRWWIYDINILYIIYYILCIIFFILYIIYISYIIYYRLYIINYIIYYYILYIIYNHYILYLMIYIMLFYLYIVSRGESWRLDWKDQFDILWYLERYAVCP